MASASRLAGRLCATSGVLAGVVFALYALALDYPVERELFLARATGYSALAVLLAALTVTPLRRLAERLGRSGGGGSWVAWRRSLGISAATMAVVHAAVVLSTYLWDSWRAVFKEPYLRAGLVTLAILLLLLATSFPRLVRMLRVRLWKPLHRLAYLAALIALQHLLLSPFADRRLVLALFGAALGLQTLRWLRTRGPRTGDGRA